MAITLPPALEHFPVQSGPFEFRTGLRGLNLQNDSPHERLFQLDAQWPDYRTAKLASRRERLEKYVCQQQLAPAVASRAVRLLINQLHREYPDCFTLEQQQGQATLLCHLSGERLLFDSQLQLTGAEHQPDPPYSSALDALCCQIQEDLSITTLDDTDHDTITFLHLCLPNYWAAEEKIGQSFLNAHLPVPGMERINRQAGALITTLMQRGPFERFTWGVTTDTRLNQHPAPPSGTNADEWQGRHFDPEAPQLWLRSERQVTVPMPEVKSFLFTIRTYLRDVKTLNPEELQRLGNAIATMPDEVGRYKGVAAQKREIVAYLESLRAGLDHPS